MIYMNTIRLPERQTPPGPGETGRPGNQAAPTVIHAIAGAPGKMARFRPCFAGSSSEFATGEREGTRGAVESFARRAEIGTEKRDIAACERGHASAKPMLHRQSQGCSARMLSDSAGRTQNRSLALKTRQRRMTKWQGRRNRTRLSDAGGAPSEGAKGSLAESATDGSPQHLSRPRQAGP